jgi:hypothetical protein
MDTKHSFCSTRYNSFGCNKKHQFDLVGADLVTVSFNY